MKGGTSPLAILLSLVLLAACGAGIVAMVGSSTAVLRGVAAGLALGWAGAAIELRLMRPHLSTDFARALRVFTLGFGVRLLMILLGMTFLDRTGLADGSAFALSVVAGFVCFLPVLAHAARPPVGNGGAAK